MLVNYRKPNLLTVGPVTLKPGVNDLSKCSPPVGPEQWAALQKTYPRLVWLIDEGIVEVVEDEKGEAVQSADLGKLAEKKAVKLVKETVDETLLLEWHDGEKRPAVVKAIETQLDAVAKAGEPKKKG